MRVAVLGCGNMGGAIIRSLSHKYGKACDIWIWDTMPSMREMFTGVRVAPPETWFLSDAPDLVILAVKPQTLEMALEPFHTTKKNTLWLSIAAGVTMAQLEEMLPDDSRVCRVMPNTPALISAGMSAFSLSARCDEADRRKVHGLLSVIGIYEEIPESQMNAVTGLSGSGPAYVYTVIEALAEGAVAEGLPYQTALKAAAQTVLGAARMVLETGEAPAVLRSQVMSPGGTTAAGNKALEQGGVRAALMNAVSASVRRAAELGG